MTASGELRPIVGNTYPLEDARRAHEDMRARRTTGKVLLDPTIDGAKNGAKNGPKNGPKMGPQMGNA